MVFNTHKEAYEWVKSNHPGSSLTNTNNPNGFLSAILEVPDDDDDDDEEEEEDKDEDKDDVCSCCGEEPCFMIEKKENFEGLVLCFHECTLLVHSHLGKERLQKASFMHHR